MLLYDSLCLHQSGHQATVPADLGLVVATVRGQRESGWSVVRGCWLSVQPHQSHREVTPATPPRPVADQGAMLWETVIETRWDQEAAVIQIVRDSPVSSDQTVPCDILSLLLTGCSVQIKWKIFYCIRAEKYFKKHKNYLIKCLETDQCHRRVALSVGELQLRLYTIDSDSSGGDQWTVVWHRALASLTPDIYDIMHAEIQVALKFVISFLYNKLPRRCV